MFKRLLNWIKKFIWRNVNIDTVYDGEKNFLLEYDYNEEDDE